jgi:hypothetical protein
MTNDKGSADGSQPLVDNEMLEFNGNREKLLLLQEWLAKGRTETADLITELVDALQDAADMIGGPDDFTGLRDNDTTEHTITVSIGAVKKFRAALAKAGGQ